MIVLRNKLYNVPPIKEKEPVKTGSKNWAEGLSGFRTIPMPDLKPEGGNLVNMEPDANMTEKNMSDRPMGITYIGSLKPKRKYYSEERMPVSSADMQKAETDGVVQRRPDGKWGIIAKKKRLWWSAGYDSRESAEAALRAYHAGKH